MMMTRSFIGLGAALLGALLVPAVHAATYPKDMEVTVEVWSDDQQELDLVYASWITRAADLSRYQIPASSSGAEFGITLGNPNKDSGTFEYASAHGKICKFTFAHVRNFSWIGLRPSSEKSATAQSIGTAEAQCDAAVIKGANSLESYSVRFRMK